MTKNENMFKTIKNGGMLNHTMSIELTKLKIPLTINDKKAIEIIELLTDDAEIKDITFKQMHEIFDCAKFYLELFQILKISE